MKTESSVFAFRMVLMFALVAMMPIPAERGNVPDSAEVAGAVSAGQSAPTIVAQGRCFNGRCF